MHWLRAQPSAAAREEAAIVRLLAHIRFATMKPAFLAERVEKEPLMDSASAFKVLAQAMREKSFALGTLRPRVASTRPSTRAGGWMATIPPKYSPLTMC